MSTRPMPAALATSSPWTWPRCSGGSQHVHPILMEDVGIWMEVVGVQARARPLCEAERCRQTQHACNYCYLMVIPVLSPGSRTGLTAPCCKPPAHPLEDTHRGPGDGETTATACAVSPAPVLPSIAHPGSFPCSGMQPVPQLGSLPSPARGSPAPLHSTAAHPPGPGGPRHNWKLSRSGQGQRKHICPTVRGLGVSQRL